MKWYKLLTRFFIWAFALSNLAVGINGIVYSVEGLITFDPMSKGEDPTYYKIILIACVLSICVAFLAVISGISLLKYKKYAPSLFIGALAFWASSTALSTIIFEVHFATWSGRKIPPELILPGLIILILSTAPSAVALILNIAYFKKRKHLFIK